MQFLGYIGIDIHTNPILNKQHDVVVRSVNSTHMSRASREPGHRPQFYHALNFKTHIIHRLNPPIATLSSQELPGLPEARPNDDLKRNEIPPATYNFRLYSGKMLELYGANLYKLDGKLCEGAFTGDDFCDVSHGGHMNGYSSAVFASYRFVSTGMV